MLNLEDAMKNNKLIRDREERALIQKDIENTPGELRADSEELLNLRD